MILFPVKSFSDGLRAGSNLFVNKVKFFLHGVGGCADSANIFIKNACRNLQPLIDLLNHIALQNLGNLLEERLAQLDRKSVV